MGNVSFSIGLFATENAQQSVQLAALADRLGYQRFWVGDSHMIWREPYVLMGAIAATTRTLTIGPGVTHPQVRDLTVTASAMTTLNELSSGRAVLGIGVGASGPENIGLKPASVDQLEESLGVLKQLLAGEVVKVNGRSVKCLFATEPKLPIFIGTRAPKAMKLAAAVADGIIYTGEVSTIGIIVDSMRKFCQQVGRNAAEVKVVYRVPCCIADDASMAREEVKGKIARTAMTHLGRLHKAGKLEDSEDRKAVERLWQLYDTYHHMGVEHSYLVRDQWVDRFAIAGTPEQVRNQVRDLTGAGIDELTIIPFGKSKESVIGSFAREVIEKL
jgi:5,10-methylenetetrahydromethanopterin reductase